MNYIDSHLMDVRNGGIEDLINYKSTEQYSFTYINFQRSLSQNIFV